MSILCTVDEYQSTSERTRRTTKKETKKHAPLNWCELIFEFRERIFCERFGLMELAMRRLTRSISVNFFDGMNQSARHLHTHIGVRRIEEIEKHTKIIIFPNSWNLTEYELGRLSKKSTNFCDRLPQSPSIRLISFSPDYYEGSIAALTTTLSVLLKWENEWTKSASRGRRRRRRRHRRSRNSCALTRYIKTKWIESKWTPHSISTIVFSSLFLLGSVFPWITYICTLFDWT